VKLVELLDEAVARAAAAMADRESEMGEDERDQVARSLGIGAVKYADLSNDRARDYVFDWDRMLAFEGNTGPYLQYAHARIRSIFRRGEASAPDPAIPPTLVSPHERALALKVLGFGEAVVAAADLCAPSKLCAYLFELASTFTTFYEHCPVLRADDGETRRSRLLLSDVSARVLATGLGLLGMDAPERM
jgi:arginyl-tRNA synthetase